MILKHPIFRIAFGIVFLLLNTITYVCQQHFIMCKLVQEFCYVKKNENTGENTFRIFSKITLQFF